MSFEEFSLVIDYIKSIEYSYRVEDEKMEFTSEFITKIIDDIADVEISNIINLKKTLNTIFNVYI